MLGGQKGFKDREGGPQRKPGWFVGAGACESSDCCVRDLNPSAPSFLGVTREKADGRGR